MFYVITVYKKVKFVFMLYVMNLNARKTVIELYVKLRNLNKNYVIKITQFINKIMCLKY